MLSVLLLDTLYKKEGSVASVLKAAYACRELPIGKLALFGGLAPLLERPIDRIAGFNVFIASFSGPGGEYIELAKSIRRRNYDAFIVFAVGGDVDVAECVRPSVRLSGMLFIPIEKLRVYETVKEIYAEYRLLPAREEHPPFTVKSGGEYFSVRVGDISFFESQGKKIAIKTRGQEILFYSNFETVLGQLPDWFIRCHKGYVINTRQISQVNFTEMTLRLKDRSVVPISRSYRDAVRSLLEPKGA